ncbi:MAG TPA: DUF2461 domain-containing protein [Ferruginibacter sp.]|nr:DUF2461 domain-containing protein [Ferruginibacter sp.]
MLESTTLKFLTNLKKNNNKPWFEENRKQYDIVRMGFLEMVSVLIKQIAKFEPVIGTQAAKDCVFRINRDVRFSKDKSPYKSHFSCYFNKEGKKSNGAGYYLHIEPGQSFAGGGIWMPETIVLAKIRQEIDYNFKDFKKITGKPLFKKTFNKGVQSEERLVRPPKGYDEQNPAIEFLKMKSYIVSCSFSDSEVLSKNFESNVVKTFAAMKPFIDYFNAAID